MKYKNLFFDLDDTIWAFSQNARNTFEEVYQKYSFDRYFDSFNHYYTLYQQRNTELWVEYGEGKITKDELNSQRFFYPLQAVGVKDEALAERGVGIRYGNEHTRLYWNTKGSNPFDCFGTGAVCRYL